MHSITIVGPTASGKTARAVELASAYGGEIISADSRQVYKGMTIGTGKDLSEYGDIPYHLIDIESPGTKYNLYRYLSDFREAYQDVENRGKVPIICGGSGMYVENAIKGVIMPEVPKNEELRSSLSLLPLEELTEKLKQYKTLHNSTDIDTKARAIRAIEIQEYYNLHPEWKTLTDSKSATHIETLVIGIDIPRDERRRRISERLRSRLEEGLVKEVEQLLQSGIGAEDLIYYGLEYKFVTEYVIGERSYHSMVNDLEIAIHQFAKRQMTWFRGMERRGTQIHWIPWNISKPDFLKAVDDLIRQQN